MLRIVIACVGFVATVSVIQFVADRVEADASFVEGSGTLVIGDHTYAFTPTTCFISDEDFVAAGTGVFEAQQFWVTASAIGLDLTVGTENEIDQPADDQLWLVADDMVQWHATGQTIMARAEMTDRRTPEAQPVVGSLKLNCASQEA